MSRVEKYFKIKNGLQFDDGSYVTTAAGFQGSRGDTGFTGSTGNAGANGSDGYTGSKGTNGSDGATGYIGSRGFTGSVGFTGSTGFTGSRGNIGYVGSRGTDAIYKATSTSTITIQNGTNVQMYVATGLSFTAGQYCVITHTPAGYNPDTDNEMFAVITGYNTLNGELDFTPYKLVGSGTYSEWTVNLAGSDGYTGSAGGTGFTGSSGIGYAGSRGDTGFVGSAGGTGITGYTGSTGSQGNQGTTGYSGSQGNIGYSGSQGGTGYAGSAGSGGYTGSKGDTGAQGNLGYTGSAGTNGTNGYTGSAGTNGTNGSTGFTGSTGSTGGLGYTGSASTVAGYVGSKGDLGYTGSKGTDGGQLTPSTYVCQATMSGNMTLTNSTDTIIQFNQADFDPQSWLNTGNYQITPKVAGYYEITASVDMPSGTGVSTNQTNMQIRKNGSSVSITQQPANTATNVTLQATRTVYMNGSTDYFTVTAWQGSGGNLTLSPNAGQAVWVTVTLIAFGPQGFTGSAGSAGATGYTGSASSMPGATGFTGSSGSAGSNGSIGYTGSAGAGGSFTGGVLTSLLTTKGVSETVYDIGTTSGTVNPDVTSATIFRLTLNGNWTMSALTNVSTGANATILVTQDGTGSRTLTTATGWVWAGGGRALSTVGGSVDMVSVFYDGNRYFASLTRGFV